MVEAPVRHLRRWSSRHALETRLRLGFGQGVPEIAVALGFHPRTVRGHIRSDGLVPPATGQERRDLILSLDEERAVQGLLSAEPGSAAQLRLRRSLMAGEGRTDPVQEQETDMRSLKEIREMSEDELRAYVASLVPGLESKATADAHAGPERTDGEISLSEDGTPRSETPGPGAGRDLA
ncbi:MAG: hypothetical protein ACON4C_05715 [Henriciella sp.]